MFKKYDQKQQFLLPISLEDFIAEDHVDHKILMIKLLNPIIRGWRNYFEECTKKRIFKELDEYIAERLRCFKAKSRSNKVLWYSFPKPELAKMGLISLYRGITE